MKIFKDIKRYLKIFNIKYSIFFILFTFAFSLFALTPVFAQRDTPDRPGASPGIGAGSAPACTLEKLQELKKSYDSKTQQEIKFEPSKILPLCVYFEGTNLEQTCGCRNINVLVSLLTKFATWLFGIVGAAALVVFIYGGFVILTAAGKAEQVKKGTDAIIAAVIGLVIVFTAQVGMRFFLETILTPGKETITAPEIAQPAKQGLNIEFVKPSPLPKPPEEKK